MSAPSGEQYEIELGDARATIVEVGGGLRVYSSGGRELVDGYGLDEMCHSARGQVLVPWPNRIRDGAYEFDGDQRQLALTEPSRQTAIHGLVRWANWAAVEHTAASVTMEHTLYPQPGYPHTLKVTVEYSLTADGLTVRTTGANLGPSACPYGAGVHPYVVAGTPTIDTAQLQIPARTRLAADERGIPTGQEAVAGTEFDFVEARAVGDVQLDTAFTDLVRGGDGLAEVRLAGAAAAVTVWLDENYTHLMIFTGDANPDVNRRSLGVEPMTCAPNAFQNGDGLVRLEPRESFSASWGIRPS